MQETLSPSVQMMNCLSCDYDLRGLPVSRCPECGRAFDPGDAATFRVRRPGDQAAVVDDARRLVIVSGAIACMFIGLLNLTWVLARLELGRWPEPWVDRAKRVGGLLDVVLPATGVSLLFVVPAMLVCLLVALLTLAVGIFSRQERKRSLRTMLAALGLCGGVVAYFVLDPQGILLWLFWDF